MNELPEPDADALTHSQAVSDHIRQRILDSGPLSFADYMELALYAPGLGYYMAGARRFGANGDFITAPGLSDLFGRCLARQCAEVIDQTGGGILELGAGNGELAASVLGALHGRDGLSYDILEPSAALRRQQRTTLVDRLGEPALAAVRWLDRLPTGFRGVILANEVMDALPVERFVIDQGQARQVQVRSREDGAFEEHFSTDPAASPSVRAVQDVVLHLQQSLDAPLSDGYRSEVNLLLEPWIRSLAHSLGQGVMLLIDYGYPRRAYYLPERDEGTFACYFRHRMHDDPYRFPGLQDMTAHVDFTRVAEAGVGAGLDLLGYTHQASLLLSLGLLELAQIDQSQADTERQQLEIARAVKSLTLPGEMGERFQAIAFGKGYDPALRGFAGPDLSRQL